MPGRSAIVVLAAALCTTRKDQPPPDLRFVSQSRK
jgi:hypothetical protein